jgi:hypothetical protein
MSLQSAKPAARSRRSGFWSRAAAEALIRLLSGAPPVRVDAPPAPRAPVVGVRKSVVCKDARGELRRIDLFLPADLVAELARPLEMSFLDGEQPVTAGEIGKAIKSNFVEAARGSARFGQPLNPPARL